MNNDIEYLVKRLRTKHAELEDELLDESNPDELKSDVALLMRILIDYIEIVNREHYD